MQYPMTTAGKGGAASWRAIASLVAFLALCALAASTGALFPTGQWYQNLEKPPLTPPSWVFGAVWTPLYVLIAIAGWLLWTRVRDCLAMRLWFVQLALNAAWTCLFFGAHAPGWALAEIALLWSVIVATIIAAWRRQRAAAWLLVPYAAWASFAAYLNAGFWWLNS